jgi:hypothetical protein
MEAFLPANLIEFLFENVISMQIIVTD